MRQKEKRDLRERESKTEIPRGEQMLYSGTNPESYIIECPLEYEE